MPTSTGLQAFTDWRYDDAERGFTEALALAPDFTMARYRLAWVYGATGRRDEAVVEIRRGGRRAASASTDREARYVRAAEAEFESRIDDALAEYRALVEAYPYDSDARHLLAGVLHDSGRYDEEIGELQVLAATRPGRRRGAQHARLRAPGEGRLHRRRRRAPALRGAGAGQRQRPRLARRRLPRPG